MRARDIMVTKVITVGPRASVRDVAKLLVTRISAVPVVDEHGQLIGIISEGDLVQRAELDTNHHRSWWLEMFSGKSKEALAKEYLKSRGCKVRDVMTKIVTTAKPTGGGSRRASLRNAQILVVFKNRTECSRQTEACLPQLRQRLLIGPLRVGARQGDWPGARRLFPGRVRFGRVAN